MGLAFWLQGLVKALYGQWFKGILSFLQGRYLCPIEWQKTYVHSKAYWEVQALQCGKHCLCGIVRVGQENWIFIRQRQSWPWLLLSTVHPGVWTHQWCVQRFCHFPNAPEMMNDTLAPYFLQNLVAGVSWPEIRFPPWWIHRHKRLKAPLCGDLLH